MKKWQKTCLWAIFGVVVGLLALKFVTTSWLKEVLPPIAVITDSSARPCAHNAAGKLDAGYKITATIHNKGGSGYVTTIAQLYKSNGTLWIQKKQKIWLDGGGTERVEFFINKEVTLFGTQPAGWDVKIEP